MPESAEKPKFLLLEAILDLIDGKIDDNALRGKLADARKSLDEIQHDFENDLNTLDQRWREGAKNEIQMVYKYFNDWENAFKSIEQYFHTHQKFDLIRAGEMVKVSSEGTNFAMENYVNQVLLVMGPTDIPHLNLLLETIREVREENAPMDKLKKITADEWLMAEGAKAELEYEQKFYQITEQALLIQAYQQLQAAIEKIGQFIKDGKVDMLEAGIEECKIAYPKIKELIPISNYKRMAQSPTSSPEANLLINMASAVIKGSVPEAMFVQALRESEEEFALTRSKILTLCNNETDSNMVRDAMEKAGEGVELYQDALDNLNAFLETREGLLVEEAVRNLKEAAEMLHNSLQFFEDLADREGKTPCVRCGKYNPPDRKTCESCGAILPKAADVTTASTFEVQVGEQSIDLDREEETLPENLEKMFIAVNQVAEGDISFDEFENTIDWLHGVMSTHKNMGFAPIPQQDQSKMTQDEKDELKQIMENLTQAKELFEEGYRDWEEGLDYFREFLDTEDKNLLIEGVKVMWDGNSKLNKVRKLTEGLEEKAKARA